MHELDLIYIGEPVLVRIDVAEPPTWSPALITQVNFYDPGGNPTSVDLTAFPHDRRPLTMTNVDYGSGGGQWMFRHSLAPELRRTSTRLAGGTVDDSAAANSSSAPASAPTIETAGAENQVTTGDSTAAKAECDATLASPDHGATSPVPSDSGV